MRYTPKTRFTFRVEPRYSVYLLALENDTYRMNKDELDPKLDIWNDTSKISTKNDIIFGNIATAVLDVFNVVY
jgi:hypothetical protein